MAEIKWTNVNDVGQNQALGVYLNAGDRQIGRVQDLFNVGTGFIDSIQARNQKAEQQRRESNTQFVINQMNQAQNLDELNKLQQQGVAQGGQLQGLFGSNIDFGQVNKSLNTWQQDTLGRGEARDNLKDYTDSAIQLKKSINEALAKGDWSTANRLVESSPFSQRTADNLRNATQKVRDNQYGLEIQTMGTSLKLSDEAGKIQQKIQARNDELQKKVDRQMPTSKDKLRTLQDYQQADPVLLDLANQLDSLKKQAKGYNELNNNYGIDQQVKVRNADLVQSLSPEEIEAQLANFDSGVTDSINSDPNNTELQTQNMDPTVSGSVPVNISSMGTTNQANQSAVYNPVSFGSQAIDNINNIFKPRDEPVTLDIPTSREEQVSALRTANQIGTSKAGAGVQEALNNYNNPNNRGSGRNIANMQQQTNADSTFKAMAVDNEENNKYLNELGGSWGKFTQLTTDGRKAINSYISGSKDKKGNDIPPEANTFVTDNVKRVKEDIAQGFINKKPNLSEIKASANLYNIISNAKVNDIINEASTSGQLDPIKVNAAVDKYMSKDSWWDNFWIKREAKATLRENPELLPYVISLYDDWARENGEKEGSDKPNYDGDNNDFINGLAVLTTLGSEDINQIEQDFRAIDNQAESFIGSSQYLAEFATWAIEKEGNFTKDEADNKLVELGLAEGQMWAENAKELQRAKGKDTLSNIEREYVKRVTNKFTEALKDNRELLFTSRAGMYRPRSNSGVIKLDITAEEWQGLLKASEDYALDPVILRQVNEVTQGIENGNITLNIKNSKKK